MGRRRNHGDPLPINTKTVHEVDYGDFESFVQEHYGKKDYSFVADIECGNDSSHSYRVEGKLDEWDVKDIEAFRTKGEGSYLAQRLLDDLAAAGRIPTGNYVIRVCW